MEVSTSYTKVTKIPEVVLNNSNNISTSKTVGKIDEQVNNSTFVSEMIDENGQPTEQAYQTAVNKMNEFMEHSQKNSKFVFHKDLERYYVEVVDAKTQEVVREVPPKQLLDAYYEIQKLLGKIFDTQA